MQLFFQEGPNLGEERPENSGKMGNNRDIYCYANRGWSISKVNIKPNFRKKMRKLNFQCKI